MVFASSASGGRFLTRRVPLNHALRTPQALRQKYQRGSGPAVAGRKNIERRSKVKRNMHALGRVLDDTDGMDEGQVAPPRRHHFCPSVVLKPLWPW